MINVSEKTVFKKGAINLLVPYIYLKSYIYILNILYYVLISHEKLEFLCQNLRILFLPSKDKHFEKYNLQKIGAINCCTYIHFCHI